MGCRTSGYGDKPDFSGERSYHVQQEKPDGSLWSVSFFLGNHECSASRQFFGTEAEARRAGDRGIENGPWRTPEEIARSEFDRDINEGLGPIS